MKELGKTSRIIMIVSFVLTGAVLAIVLFSLGPDDGDAHLRVCTANRLGVVCISIAALEDELGQPAPTSMPALVAWLLEYDLVRNRPGEVDGSRGMIYDRWGEEVLLVVQDGRLTGLGSPGPDGIWRDGRGDDIMVMLKEVRP